MSLVSFTVGQRIGSGGYGEVFLVQWQGIPCAAKKFFVTKEELDATEIQKEISILQHLRHRNIIQFYTTHFYEESLFVIMELAERGSLTTAIEQGMLDWQAKRHVAHQIARGLEYIHNQNFVHADLKSDNVLLTEHMQVKICDFGLSEVRSLSASRSGGGIKGTLRWMAPELFAVNTRYTAKSDVYALGVIMWEMAADCTKPFKDQNNNAVVAMLIKRGERDTVPEDTPEDYRRWLELCWDQDPAKRPAASEVILAQEPYDTDQASIAWSADDEPIDGHPQPAFMIELTYRAAANDAEAQVLLADKYAQGQGVAKSHVNAFYWFRRAAQQGHAQAQQHLGDCFLHGRGTRQSDQQAAEWHQRAAEQGVAVSQYRLGWMYANGRGVPQKSDTQAFKWYLKAAQQEYDEAQYRVGSMYVIGVGVEQNDKRAALWCRKAAMQGHADAQKRFGTICSQGRGVHQSHVDAVSWWQKSAAQGNADAQVNLGWAYQNGRGVEKSNVEAVSWFQKAAAQGDSGAQFSLGCAYASGEGIAQNKAEAVLWWRKAAAGGNKDAQSSLEKLLADSEDVARWRAAAEKGDIDAQFNLGCAYSNGQGVDQNDVEAVLWFRLAAEQGSVKAQLSLGKAYVDGRGVQKSVADARQWFFKAAEYGDINAVAKLGEVYRYDSRALLKDLDQKIASHREAAKQLSPHMSRPMSSIFSNFFN